MTLVEERPAPGTTRTRGLVGWLTTTDHKDLGLLSTITAFAFFLLGGLLALGLRAELARPGRQLVGESAYNQLFTMHGSVMMFLFAVPMALGLATYLVPLQVGAPHLALPRLAALSYWLYLGGGLTMVSGFLTARGAAAFGWTAYAPLSDGSHNPGAGADLWIVGLAVAAGAALLSATNIIVTVACLRAPGMILRRMPVFTWNMLVVAALVVLAVPVSLAGLLLLYADRRHGSHFFDAGAGGAPGLWQRLFWFSGDARLCLVTLPFFGVVAEIIPVFAHKPLSGYRSVVLAAAALGVLGVASWAGDLFATGAPDGLLPTAIALLVLVPVTVLVCNWLATMWRGHLTFESPMLWCLGFLAVFLVGALSGPVLAAGPLGATVTGTAFAVGHLHYVLVGTAGFGFFAGLYFWYPKATGRRLSEPLAALHFWSTLIGFNLTFWPQYLLGRRGMPRRVPDYAPDAGWTYLNLVSSIGAAVVAVGTLFLLWNLWMTPRRGAPAGDDPWGANSLEWATSSPPPRFNFAALPPIHSERPVFDARHAGAATTGATSLGDTFTAGDVGPAPASSAWPVMVAAGAVVVANGLVFGPLVGVPGVLLAAVGLVIYLREVGGRTVSPAPGLR